MTLLLLTQDEVLLVDASAGSMRSGGGLHGRRPTCIAADPEREGRAWCGTEQSGVLRTEDGGASWGPSGLPEEHITAIAASGEGDPVVWAGTEPSAMWRSEDGGTRWERTADVVELPSSSEWSFPPKPATHHVRWIASHPEDGDRLWVAIEAGALISTADGGRTWRDRTVGGPWDTHELAVHRDTPDTLRIAAGDGYFESPNGGNTWESPSEGLDIRYFRSVAIDPGRADVILLSGATSPRTTYVAGRSDGRLYRRIDGEPWQRVVDGWPDPPSTVAPLLLAGAFGGELWAADERGLHRTEDGGRHWQQVASFQTTPNHLRGLASLRPISR